MKYIIITLFTFICVKVYATQEVDKFNTYQWNKKNHLKDNGKVDTDPWYEWWYYKVVLPERNESFFFVYGVVNPWDKYKSLKGTRAYVGVGDFSVKRQIEAKYPISEFDSSYNETNISISTHLATDKRITGNLVSKDNENYSWDISIDKNWSFNAEGWMMGTMLTEIEWYPAQADATCSGQIIRNGEEINFKNAPCYQDRNWGKSFPEWWTWIVSNYFIDHPNSTLAIGGGRPKLRNGKLSPYAGVSIGLNHEGIEYSFRPIDLDKIVTKVKYGSWEITGISRKYKIVVIAKAPKSKFMDLQFVTPEGRIFHDYETLSGEVYVRLYQRYGVNKWILKADLYSPFAGIEYGSSDEQLLKLMH